MNEFLREFIMTGIRDMIEKDVALYQTYQYASGWFSRGVLLQEDLEEIQRLYEEKEVQEEVVEDTVVEEGSEGEIVVEDEEVVTEEQENAEIIEN